METREKLRPKRSPPHKQQQSAEPAEQSEGEGEDATEEEQEREGPLPCTYSSDDLTKFRANI